MVQMKNEFIVCNFKCTSDINNKDNNNSFIEDDDCDGDYGMGKRRNVRNILVLVDQHAADERVRVEKLMKEFCEFKQIDNKNIDGGDDDESKVSMVETFRFIGSPIKIFLSNREAKVAWRFQKYFNIWGIFFTD